MTTNNLTRASLQQEGIWLHSTIEADASWVMVQSKGFKGTLDEHKLRNCFDFLLRNIPVLSANFKLVGEELHFFVQERTIEEVVSVHRTELTYEVLEESLRENLLDKYEDNLDLRLDPLFSIEIVYTKQHTVLVIKTHHIIVDGLSMQSIWKMIRDGYENPNALSVNAPDYTEFCALQRRLYSESPDDSILAFWKERIEGIPVLLDSKLYKASEEVLCQKNRTILSSSELALIREKCASNGILISSFFYAAYVFLLYAFTGRKDLAISNIVHGRNLDGRNFIGVIGHFSNRLITRHDLSKLQNLTLKELVMATQGELLATLTRDVPFEYLMRSLGHSLGAGENYYQASFNMMKRSASGLKFREHENLPELDFGVSLEGGLEEDISLFVLDGDEEFSIQTNVLIEPSKSDIAKQIHEHYLEVVRSFERLDLADPIEVNLFSSLSHVAPKQVARTTFNIYDLFHQQIQVNSEKTALVAEGIHLTYSELENAVERTSGFLKRHGIKVNEIVPIFLSAKHEVIISILSILRLGAIYVPVDSSYPANRVNTILEDTSAKRVVTDLAGEEALKKHKKIHFLKPFIAEEPAEKVSTISTIENRLEEDVAYVIYTSGSTGVPKGVMVKHANILNAIQGWQKVYNLDSEPVNLLSLSSVGFDVFSGDIFRSLLQGGTMILVTDVADLRRLVSLINKYEISFFESTPQLLRSLNLYLGSNELRIQHYIKFLIAGSDVAIYEDLHGLEKIGQLYNSYGATETTIDSTLFKVSHSGMGRIPVGSSLPSQGLVIINKELELLPIGAIGELCFYGGQVGLGYLNQPDLTKERFIPNPFDGGLTRLYKTGDLARMLPDGNIEFIGRRDHQVKVRGYRIELGEIEAVLGRFPGLSQSLVETSLDSTGERQLVGYIKEGESEFDREAVESYLLEFLPAYMVPRLWVEVADFPLTSNGKLDRAALLKPEGTVYSSTKYVGPRDEMEHGLQSLWHTLLESEEIGIASNFFELGGHSLMVIRMLSHVRSMYGKEVSIGSFFESPTISSLAEKIRQDAARVEQTLERDSRATRPLSYSQERLWFIDQLEGSTQYHVPWLMKLSGELDINKLETSLRFLVGRHEPLHTVIEECDVELTLRFLDPSLWEMGRRSVAGQDSDGMALIRRDLVSEPFDLTTDYLLRCTLLERGADQYELILVFHHISFDGWSQGVFERELMKLYAQGSGVLAPMRVSYSDYSIWQRGELSGQRLEEKLTYWREQLGGVSVLELPTDKARPKRRSTSGGMERKTLGVSQSQVRDYCVRHGVTPYMYFLSVFKALLHRYSGQEDLCVGSPVAGRTHREMESMVGLFVNTVAVRSTMSSSDRFIDFQARLKQRLLELYAYQDVPFEKVVEAVVEERELSVTPVFQVMFVHQGFEEAAFSLNELKIDRISVPHDTSKFDLTMIVLEEAGEVRLSLEYSTALYDQSTIVRMLGHFEELVKSTMATPEIEVGDLQLLSTVERKELLYDFNDTQVPYPSSSTLVDLLEGSSVSNSEAIAVVYEESTLTYGELRALSNQLSHHLIKRGVGVETMVPICIDRSLEMIVGILGILKAGGAYVPIDPEYPEDRIRYMLSDTGSSLILTSTQNEEKIRKIHSGEILVLDGSEQMLSEESTDLPDIDVGPDNLAYVIYTSGSTGKSKGVLVEHKNVVNRLNWAQKITPLSSKDAVLQKTSFSFDVSVWELIWPLLSGAKLVFAVSRVDVNQLIKTILDKRITMIHFVPSMLEVLLSKLSEKARFDHFSFLKTVICSGEQLQVKTTIKFKQLLKTTELFNLYGPTETTIDSTYWKCPEVVDNILIGKPVDNTQAYILDDRLNLVPLGVAAELYLGGAGLSRGYLNQPDLTKERFIPNPFDGGLTRLYKTGDLARMLPDGNIEFIGRRDHQVKVRGYRIELGEIETILGKYPGLSQSLVETSLDSAGERQLVGYIKEGETEFDRETVESYLSEFLPAYMVPRLWVELPVFPLTSNGKLDRAALPKPEGSAYSSTKYVAPRDEMEHGLQSLWHTLLESEEIGIASNFFELGGHSLMVIRMLSHVRSMYGKEVSIGSFFESPTISSLAEKIRQDAARVEQTLERDSRATRPLSYSQERLWFIDQLEGSTQYHVPWLMKLSGELDINKLETSLRFLVGRHEPLHTVIEECDGELTLGFLDPSLWEMGRQSVVEQDPDGMALIRRDLVSEPFDLTTDYLLRCTLLERGADQYELILVFHHISFDGWSQGVFERELMTLYAQGSGVLAPMRVSYSDYSIWQRGELSGQRLEEKLTYWREQLGGVSVLELPTDKARPKRRSVSGGMERKTLGVSQSQVRDYCVRHGVTPYMYFLSVFKVLLHRYSGQEDLCVGSPVAGRTHREMESMVGFFVNTVAVRSTMSSTDRFVDFQARLKQRLLELYAYQDVPFEKVVEAVVEERELSVTPVFQVMFVHQGFEEAAFSLNELKIDRISVPHDTSKFDLTMIVLEEAGEVRLSLEYSTALYDQSTIARMLGHFEELVKSTMATPEIEVGDLQLLSTVERKELLYDFNDTQVSYPSSSTLVDLLEGSSVSNSEAIAVVYEESTLTYGELRALSNQLSHHLIKRGVGVETMVPICIDRSLEMIVGILGILKAGGAYVPIDPEYPEDRIRYMLSDTGSSLILTSTQNEEKIRKIHSGEILVLDGGEQMLSEESTDLPDIAVGPDNLAYVIYTSGSTGKPKGVQVEHKNVVSLVKGPTYVSSTKQDVILSTASTSFDATTFEYWSALLNGGKLILLDQEEIINPDSIRFHIHQHLVSKAWLTSGLFNQLFDADPAIFSKLDTLIVGGDRVSGTRVSKAKKELTSLKIVNGYGPTENTTFSLTCNLTLFADGLVPIGKPLVNRQAYILDDRLNLVPLGVAAELYLGGAGLSRGYLNQPDLTKERFIPNPFDGGLTRLYKTGDLARMLPDGNIEFIGRRDHQVKVRGYRIELGEIETILGKYPGLSQSLVETSLDSAGERQLVGYIKEGETEFDRETVESYLSEFLPAYMVPRLWVELPVFPLTSNGKLDRAALPKPEGSAYSSTKYVAPRDEMEHGLQSLWHTLLESEEIGIASNFFELGGHSLMVIRMLSHVRSMYGKEVSIGSFFESPTISSLAEKIRQDAARVEQTLERDSRATRPLSYSQERLWFIDQLEGSTQYHVPWLMKLSGELDINKLETSLRFLVGRHEPLHTVIEECDGELTLGFLDPSLWEMGRQSVVEQDPDGMALIRRDLVSEPFDLTTDYLLRCTLLERGADQYELILVFHHISFDGWSQGVFERELMTLYAQGSGVLAPMRVSYSDYSIWQRGELSGQRLEEKLTYWREQLGGVSVLELPTDKARPKRRSTSGGMERKTLGVSQSQVRDYCVRHGVTPYMYFLSVFKVLLHRYSGQEDLCVGSPVAGRTHREMESMVGLFVNTVAVRSTMSSTDRFVDFQARLKQRLLELYAYQDVPFEKIVEAVVEERELSVTPVFQVMFVHQGFEEAAFSLNELKIDRISVPHDTSKFDLTMIVLEEAGEVRLSLEYSTALYDQSTIVRMLGHFEELVKSTMATPEREVGDLQLLSTVERKELLYDFNDTQVPYPSSSTLVDLLEGSSVSNSEAIAVVYEESTLTYGELRALSNQLSHHLIKRGVGVETMVPICIDRSLEMIVGILGILKAGGAYVPIDPEYPEDRIRYMLSDTGSSLILTSTQNEEKIRKIHSGEILVLDGGEQMLSEESTDLPDIAVGPDNLAYVIYTSGSTGKPKGVLVEHKNVVRLFLNDRNLYDFSNKDVWTLFHSFSFDFSVWEIFGALLFGGRLEIISNSLRKDTHGFLDFLKERQVTVLNQTPANFYNLSEIELATIDRSLMLRYVIFGGDALAPDKLLSIKESYPSIKFINMYGITETTVHVTAKELDEMDMHNFKSNIGKAIPTTECYILDDSYTTQPIGVVGEIYVGGAGVSRGYLNQPELTRERFVTNVPGINGRLYRSGDLGRWMNNGEIEYICRADNQVKVRGHRIELGEINETLRQHPEVKDCTVEIRKSPSGQNNLVGYVVKENNAIGSAELKLHLNKFLPGYMVPGLWAYLDKIPVTNNGKIDHQKLPEPEVEEKEGHVSAVSPKEVLLTEIWEELLGVSNISMNDKFFALGGDSITAIQMVNRARSKGLSMRVADLFEHQSISMLARYLKNGKEHIETHREIGELTGECELLPIQKWFFESEASDFNHFNQSRLFRLAKHIDKTIIQRSFELLISHHDALRFSYHNRDDEWVQVYGSLDFQLEKYDLSASLNQDQLSIQLEQVGHLFQSDLDIEQGDNLRVVYIETPDWESHNRLLVIIHHLVIDEVSWRIIVEDLNGLVTSKSTNQMAIQWEKGTSYRQWAKNLIKYATEVQEEQSNYWDRSRFNLSPLPKDKHYSGIVNHCDIKLFTDSLSKEDTIRLLTKAVEFGNVEVRDVLISALFLSISQWSKNKHITIGLEGHGREEVSPDLDLNRTIGWFTILFPFSVDLSSNETPGSLLTRIKEQLRAIPDKGIGYGMFRDAQTGDPWEIVFNYFGKIFTSTLEGHFAPAKESTGDNISDSFPVREKISLNCMVAENELVFVWRYSEHHFLRKTMDKLATEMKNNLMHLIDFCIDGNQILTPSDFGLSGQVSMNELDSFLKVNEQSSSEDVMKF